MLTSCWSLVLCVIYYRVRRVDLTTPLTSVLEVSVRVRYLTLIPYPSILYPLNGKAWSSLDQSSCWHSSLGHRDIYGPSPCQGIYWERVYVVHVGIICIRDLNITEDNCHRINITKNETPCYLTKLCLLVRIYNSLRKTWLVMSWKKEKTHFNETRKKT